MVDGNLQALVTEALRWSEFLYSSASPID